LREFERLGLVTRKIYAEVPPRVEYQITAYGKSLRTPLATLAQWSTHHGEPLFRARKNSKSASKSAG
jgi:DNA-binding HxlR family transcriptional regulator